MITAVKKVVRDIAEAHNNYVNPPKPEPETAKVVHLNTYNELATEIGYQAPASTVQELRNYMAAKELPIYDTDKVWVFMDSLARKKKCNWYWFPLRESDADSSLIHARNNGDTRTRLYEKEVPIHILRMIANIPKELRDKLSFYVTDYAVLNPDPFLMAIPKDARSISSITVLAVWDEPGFE